MSSLEQSLSIPTDLRYAVWDRDGATCRLCGQTGNLIAHHLHYGGTDVGMGGRRFHSLENLVLLGGLYQHNCHDVVHGTKLLWRPVLEAAILLPGTTGLQVLRWLRAGQTPSSLGLPGALVEELTQAVERWPSPGSHSAPGSRGGSPR